jgi:heme exporter protein A
VTDSTLFPAASRAASSVAAFANAASGTAPLLAAADVACRRGTRVLFRGLQLAVSAGQVVWLRGDNGRGKTSLLRLLSGLASPEEGQITWRGLPIRKAGAAYRAELVYIGHLNGLKDDLTALESLRFMARLHERPASEAELEEALRAMGVHARRHAATRTLSQGQRRRVALARLCLEKAPSLWLLDEPFDALDTTGIATLNGLLGAHAARGGAVVLTSHQPLSLREPAPIEFHLGGTLAEAPAAA